MSFSTAKVWLHKICWQVLYPNHSHLHQIAFAIILGLGTIVIMGSVQLIDEIAPVSLAFASVITSAIFLGLVPGLITAGICAFGSDYYFVNPTRATFTHLSDLFRLIVLILVALFSSSIVVKLRAMVAELEFARKDQEQVRVEREHILSVVAHDLRNPLAAINLTTHLIERSLLPNPKPEAVERHVARMRRSLKQVGRIIEDLLDSEKIGRGSLRIESRTGVRFDVLLEDLRSANETFAEQKQIALVFYYPVNWNPALEIDPQQLLRALGNLVNNAIKFSPPGTRIEVTASEEAHECQIAVRDHGPGISSSEMPRLFEKFWQRQETAFKGTGLGLYITDEIIRRHGGLITVESEVGRGSTFVVHLPKLAANPGLPFRTIESFKSSIV